ncbi:MAG: Recombination inhibitory protein MutS2 [Candidatus Ozemobacter sibiricus]|uniref:Endonuclease MutS2 n=1 Tax=Candidatus Ozemobacter sibiricus TaxID=2268124 RepID=A0A367ZRH9_9BACT|nr:MAG: Recombination inhibitory protein MutS2 [Candidatus Ozemobacter sibiricus]
MEATSLDHLEFPKILGLIAELAGSEPARTAIAALAPATDRARIEADLADLDELVAFREAGGRLPIGGLRDLRGLLHRLRTGGETLTGDELLLVRADLEVLQSLKKAFRREDQPRELRTPRGRLDERVEALPSLEGLHQRILVSISEKGEVRDEASARLGSLRRELQQTRAELERRLSELVNTQTDIVQDRFFTIRNDRYVVPVKSSSQSLLEGIVHDQSGSGQTLYVEPLAFLGLNNRLVRLRSEEREEVQRVLRELTALVAANLADLTLIFETLVFFDVLHAKARFAEKYDARRPEIAPDGRLELIEARHPLLHPTCVPMDITLEPSRSCVVITGPNGGGKTVALKIVGVNALLMQTGCYVLARSRSALPIFREVLTDIGESQSIEDHLSTFTAHLKRLKEILDTCDARCLVLIDEIGTGTDPEEGALLAYGVLQEIRRRGAFALVTSHYEALKQLAFTTPGFVNAAMEFDYQTFRPTFKFMMGVPGRSNALAIARLFGLPDAVLGDLERHREGKNARERELLEALEQERARIEALRRQWEEKTREIEAREREADRLLAQLKEFRRTRRDEAVEAFEERFRSALKELEALISRLKTRLAAAAGAAPPRAGSPPPGGPGAEAAPAGQESGGAATLADDLAAARAALGTARRHLDELAAPPPTEEPRESAEQGPLQPGDHVLWGRLLQRGRLQSVDPGRGRAIVDFDGKTMTIPLAELRRAEPPIGKSTAPPPPSLIVAPPATVADEIDLRGLRVDEALEKVEAYLKLAQAQKKGRVFLIHGKGTGALHRAITEFLKRSPWKHQHRPGRYGEGDLGVTVVVFDPAADKAPEGYNTEAPPEGRPRRQKGDRDRPV